ncbi:hypothetical protein [Streptomyces sp. NPDC014746]|uniref:hypothetical protein n=1 Tax=Streptomyces sp. NPDC014746 TaxID=3364904 RepID=UPI0036F9B7B1
MVIADAVSVVADVLVIVLALLLTQAWGRRFPAWPLALPLWAATGLLAPIMAGYPAQLAVALLTGDERAAAPAEPFLDPWVFGVVHGGFILQGLALGTLFALYARDRWGHLWQGRLGELPARASGPGARALAVAGAVAALVPAAPHLLWATGATTGLSPWMIATRDSDDHALETRAADANADPREGSASVPLRDSVAGPRPTGYHSCRPAEGDRTVDGGHRQEREPGSTETRAEETPPLPARLCQDARGPPDVVGHDSGQHHSDESRRPPALRPTLVHVSPCHGRSPFSSRPCAAPCQGRLHPVTASNRQRRPLVRAGTSQGRPHRGDQPRA